MKKLPIFATLKEGLELGMVNCFSLIAATILYILTIWVPYINVGTTLAMAALPVEMAKGNRSRSLRCRCSDVQSPSGRS